MKRALFISIIAANILLLAAVIAWQHKEILAEAYYWKFKLSGDKYPADLTGLAKRHILKIFGNYRARMPIDVIQGEDGKMYFVDEKWNYKRSLIYFKNGIVVAEDVPPTDVIEE